MLENPIRKYNYQIIFNTEDEAVNEMLRITTHSFEFVREATTNENFLKVTFILYTDNFNTIYNLYVTKKIPLKVVLYDHSYKEEFLVWDAVTEVKDITFAGDCVDSNSMQVVVTFGNIHFCNCNMTATTAFTFNIISLCRLKSS